MKIIRKKLPLWVIGITLIGATASQGALIFKTARGPKAGDGAQTYAAATTTVQNVENEFHELTYGSLDAGIGQLTDQDVTVTNTFGVIANRSGDFTMVFKGFTTNNVAADLYVNNGGLAAGLEGEALKFSLWDGQVVQIEFDLSGMNPASMFLNTVGFNGLEGVSPRTGLDFCEISKNNIVLETTNDLNEVAVGVEIADGDVIRLKNVSGTAKTSPRFAIERLTFDSTIDTTLNPDPKPLSQIEFKLLRGPDTESHRFFQSTKVTVGTVEEDNHLLTYDSLLNGADTSIGGIDFTGVQTNVWGVGRTANTTGAFFDGTTGSFSMTFLAMRGNNTSAISVNNNQMGVVSGESQWLVEPSEAIHVTFDLSDIRPSSASLSLDSMSMSQVRNLNAGDVQFVLDGTDITAAASLQGNNLFTFTRVRLRNGQKLEIKNVHSAGNNARFGISHLRFGSAISDYAQWKERFNLGEDVEDDADSDGDMLSNIYEYGLGGDPTNAADRGYSLQHTVIEGGDAFEYVYPRRKNSENEIEYNLEGNIDLVFGEWNAITGNIVTITTGDMAGDFEYEAVTNAILTEGKNRQFIRLIIQETE